MLSKIIMNSMIKKKVEFQPILKQQGWTSSFSTTKESFSDVKIFAMVTTKSPPVENMVSVVEEKKTSFISKMKEILKMWVRMIRLGVKFLPLLLLSPLCYFTPTKGLFYSYMVYAFRSSGPCFVKLGQWLGSRRDLFSYDACAAFGVLPSHAECHSS